MLVKKNYLLVIGLILIIFAAGCGSAEDASNEENEGAEGTNEENYSEAVEYTITGIEPGAGITVSTENAIEEYDSLSGWTVETSSTAGMVTLLGEALENEEPIIVTGWNPHWKFAEYDNLKYLEDPKGVYGEAEVIKTLARNGLEEDKPNAYQILDQFYWEVEDMEGIMHEAQQTGEEIEAIATRWVEDNPDKVAEWTEGVEDVDGVPIELVSIPWDSERASSAVVAEVLTQKGFDVTVTPVDVSVVFESIANGDADATLAAWMPITHQEFYEDYEEDFVDLGANLEGAILGLVVPEYMDIDSIEDLEPNE